ncbi:MAG: hypothetical protein AAF226_05370 [Verrucomicrobiota bacterium]
MKNYYFFLLLIGIVCFPFFGVGQESPTPEETFRESIDQAQKTYRASYGKILEQADRVEVFLVDFDNLIKGNPFSGEGILIEPYSKRAKILQQKSVDSADDRKKLLKALSTQIAKPEHTGGAFCHFPIHGIKIYSNDRVLHEGTFCWVCGNFSFSYPQGSDWLDVNAELREILSTLMPIPQSELDRFYKKHPNTKPKNKKGEQ